MVVTVRRQRPFGLRSADLTASPQAPVWAPAREPHPAANSRRSCLPVHRYPLRTLPGAEAPPANLGRRAFPRRPATHGPAWRRLAPGRRRRRLAVTAARDARASRHFKAADRGRRARFLGADDFLQSTAL